MTILVACDGTAPQPLRWLPDSGADVNAVNEDSLKELDEHFPLDLVSIRDAVVAANCSKLNGPGMVSVTLTH